MVRSAPAISKWEPTHAQLEVQKGLRARFILNEGAINKTSTATTAAGAAASHSCIGWNYSNLWPPAVKKDFKYPSQ